MKLFVIVLLAGVASAARLENTYLPPGSAQTAGGSGQFLSTPFGERNSNGHSPSIQYSPVIPPRQRDFSQSGHQRFAPASHGFYGAPIRDDVPISTQKALAPSPVYGPANFRSNNPEALANTLRADNTNDGSGNYHFEYETENKISQSEQGQRKPATDGDATIVHGSYSYAGDNGKQYTVNYIADENGFQPSGEHINQAISMTASDAARAALSENQHGYSYNAQKGYSAQNGYQEGYGAQQQQGFDDNQGGINGYQGGFNKHQGELTANQQGFNTHQPAFSTKQQGVGGQQTYSQYEVNKGGYRY